MDIFTTHLAGATVGGSGQAIRRRRTNGVTEQQVSLTLPTGYNLTSTTGNWVTYNSRKYGAGAGTDNALIDEHFNFLRQGMAAPTKCPTLAATTGPGRTGSCIIYISFYDKLTDEHSPLSGASNTVSLANQAALITTIQTISPDAPRPTHVAVWVSMDGASPRLSTMRDIGVSTITENVATLALGAAFPTTFARMARVALNAVYHDRYIGAGDAIHPDYVYVSAIGRPERYEGLAFKTRNGEPVTALLSTRDICLVMTPVSAYALRGYRDSDMTMTLIDADFGAVNQSSTQVAHGNGVGVDRGGFWLYNGAFHRLSNDRQSEWAKFYSENRLQVENAVAVVDPNEYTYILYTNDELSSFTYPKESTKNKTLLPQGVETGTIAWGFDYSSITPELGGGLAQPVWFNDLMSRKVSAAGVMNLPGSRRADVYLGSCDGYVRGKDATDDNDDEDMYGKRLWIRTAAYSMADPGGDILQGKTFRRLWSYVQSEDKPWTLYAKGGDEEAWMAIDPDNALQFWKDDVADSDLEQTFGADTYFYTPKTVAFHMPQKVSGRMLTLEYTCLNALNFRWRGFGGTYIPGPANRPPMDVSGGV